VLRVVVESHIVVTVNFDRAARRGERLMFKTTYHPEAAVFAVYFGQKGAYVESEEVAPGVTLDFDADGQVIGVEVLRKRMASKKHEEPKASAE
jgi:uncharacterized protein YuzE